MIRYAVTDRMRFAGKEGERRAALAAQAQRLALAGVDYLQVREKDLAFAETSELALQLQASARVVGGTMRVLLNAAWPAIFGRPVARGAADPGRDAAELRLRLATWPDGVGLHLSSPALAAVAGAAREDLEFVRQVRAVSPVSVACHGVAEARLAHGVADLLLFAPVFEKRVGGTVRQAGAGLGLLAEVCRAAAPLPVLAMGGVAPRNAIECIEAGAAGVAGIRLFLE